MIQKDRAEKIRRRLRARARKHRVRLSVFVSNQHIYAQLIDDSRGVTLVSASDHETDLQGKVTDTASKVGRLLGEKALKKKLDKIFFDRGGKKYHGRVAALADGAREAGLKF